MFYVMICIVIGIIFYCLSRLLKTNGIENLYIDEGKKTPVLYSKNYGLSAKPDAIIKDEHGKIAVIEYKSRKGKSIYDSDIVQAKGASLVARENGYAVDYIIIKTQSAQKTIQLPKSNKALSKEIQPFINIVKNARKGRAVTPNPAKFKCRFCSYKNVCQHSI